MTTGTLFDLIKLLRKPHIDGLTLSGGDPMYPKNRQTVRDIARTVKLATKKTIWLYTGYSFEQIKTEPALYYLDVVVDGEYMQGLEPALYRGSDNQRIWRKIDGEWKADE